MLMGLFIEELLGICKKHLPFCPNGSIFGLGAISSIGALCGLCQFNTVERLLNSPVAIFS